jgi:hypothetical protein
MFRAFRYDGLAFLVDEELMPWSPDRYLMSRQLTWAEARQPVQRKDATGDAMKVAHSDSYAPTQPRGGLEARSDPNHVLSDPIISDLSAPLRPVATERTIPAQPCHAALPHMRRR